MKRLSYYIPIGLLIACLAGGCAGAADLEPAPTAEEVPGLEEAAVSSVDDVQIVAQADEWPGPQPIENEVTPVRVVIENNSGVPVAIRYDLFSLVSPTGRQYSALPPFEITGTVEEPVVLDTYTPITAPAFTYTDFQIAPFYSPLYPGVTAFTGPFRFDPIYYDATFTYWQDIALPTQEMLERAIPEGVLNAGGRLEGYLYFENVSDDLQRVAFRADLVNAQTGDVFGEIRIPFQVM